MKKNKLSIFYLLFCCNIACNSQEIPPPDPSPAVVSLPFENLGRETVEESPTFKNGDLKRFIDTNFNLSLVEKYKIPKGNYEISIGAQLNEEGLITQTIYISSWSNLNYKNILEDELIRVLKTSQGWRPYRYCGRTYPSLINVKYQFNVSQELSYKRKNKLMELKNEGGTIVEVDPIFKDGNIDSFITVKMNKKLLDEHDIPKGVYKTSIRVQLSKEGNAVEFIELTYWGRGDRRGFFEEELIRILKTSSGWHPYKYCGVNLPKSIEISYNFIKE